MTNEEAMYQENVLAGQIPEYVESNAAPEVESVPVQGVVGSKLGHKIGGYNETDREADAQMVKEKKLSRMGDNIYENIELRDGWVDVDRELLGERSKFYPEGWKFRIRPATVEVVRNWSTVDEKNPFSVDDAFNEILKYCLGIKDANGNPVPWSSINTWDRLFFVLLIRNYTMKNGEKKLEFIEDCPNCDVPVTFTLDSMSLMYDLPDEEIMRYYSPEDRVWMIDPYDFGLDGEEAITLYLPTVEKDANIRAWMIEKLRENQNAKIDPVFIKFLPWLAQKISKDTTLAKGQIRKFETQFKSWDVDMFTFMDSVIRNVTVTPSDRILAVCPSCGEEVTAVIRFPDGISSLFAMGNRHRQFGKK